MNRETWKALVGEVLRFGLVGGITTLVNYGVFYLLYSTVHLPYLLASASGFVSGVVVGFPLNQAWTFRSGGARSFLPYLVVYGLSLGTGLVLLGVLTDVFHVDPRVGNLLVLAYTILFNFAALRLVVFRKN